MDGDDGERTLRFPTRSEQSAVGSEAKQGWSNFRERC